MPEQILVASVKILVESVVDNYVKSSELNNLEQVEERFEGLNREIIKQELVGIKTICEKLTKTTEGKFKTYIAIELSAQKLVDKFHERIMKDDLLMIDYDYEKFKDTFEKEMGKLNKIKEAKASFLLLHYFICFYTLVLSQNK